MLKEPDALSITGFHDAMLSEPEELPAHSFASLPPVWRGIATNHRYNMLLWNEEDKARRTDVKASDIAASKRLIDQYNQKRNDAVESIDEVILSMFDTHSLVDGARRNSETAGAMIDRLSILCLKIYHMRAQTQRSDASTDHIVNCTGKLHQLIVQSQDLGACFDQLLVEARQGRAYFKVYRQFKMYNDPALNPYLYGQADAAAVKGVLR